MKILTYHGQVIDEIYPIIIPNQISTISMHIPSLVKIHWHSFKLSLGNENTDARTDRQMDTRTAKVIPQYPAIILWCGIIPREQAALKNILRSKRGPFGLHIHIHTMPYTHPHSPSTPAIYCKPSLVWKLILAQVLCSYIKIWQNHWSLWKLILAQVLCSYIKIWQNHWSLWKLILIQVLCSYIKIWQKSLEFVKAYTCTSIMFIYQNMTKSLEFVKAYTCTSIMFIYQNMTKSLEFVKAYTCTSIMFIYQNMTKSLEHEIQ